MDVLCFADLSSLWISNRSSPPVPTPSGAGGQILVANEGHESVPALRRCWHNCQPGGSHRSGLPLSPIAGGDAVPHHQQLLTFPQGWSCGGAFMASVRELDLESELTL